MERFHIISGLLVLTLILLLSIGAHSGYSKRSTSDEPSPPDYLQNNPEKDST